GLLVMTEFQARVRQASRHDTRAVGDSTRLLWRVQLSGVCVSVFYRKTFDPSPRCPGDLSPAHGLESALNLWRQCRRRVESSLDFVPVMAPSRPSGRLFYARQVLRICTTS